MNADQCAGVAAKKICGPRLCSPLLAFCTGAVVGAAPKGRLSRSCAFQGVGRPALRCFVEICEEVVQWVFRRHGGYDHRSPAVVEVTLQYGKCLLHFPKNFACCGPFPYISIKYAVIEES